MVNSCILYITFQIFLKPHAATKSSRLTEIFKVSLLKYLSFPIYILDPLYKMISDIRQFKGLPKSIVYKQKCMVIFLYNLYIFVCLQHSY